MELLKMKNYICVNLQIRQKFGLKFESLAMIMSETQELATAIVAPPESLRRQSRSKFSKPSLSKPFSVRDHAALSVTSIQRRIEAAV